MFSSQFNDETRGSDNFQRVDKGSLISTRDFTMETEPLRKKSTIFLKHFDEKKQKFAEYVTDIMN